MSPEDDIPTAVATAEQGRDLSVFATHRGAVVAPGHSREDGTLISSSAADLPLSSGLTDLGIGHLRGPRLVPMAWTSRPRDAYSSVLPCPEMSSADRRSSCGQPGFSSGSTTPRPPSSDK